jgi:phosphate transport system permease protein
VNVQRYTVRKWVDRFARAACLGATLVALVPLFSVLTYIGAKGIGHLHLAFFTGLPAPVGEPGGGMGNAIVGSFLLVAVGSLFSKPLGILAGIYLSEFGAGQLARAVRFSADVMSGIPSITIGIFIYTVLVLRMRHFSLLAGGLALAVIMLPTVTRTTEEMLRLVPHSLREAGLALGAPKWRVTLKVVLRTGVGGIVTGVMLAIARAAGETAPLLFTALNNRLWSVRLDKPVASLPVQIFTYAVAPFENWHEHAWTAALVLLVLVLVLNICARAITFLTRGFR